MLRADDSWANILLAGAWSPASSICTHQQERPSHLEAGVDWEENFCLVLASAELGNQAPAEGLLALLLKLRLCKGRRKST